MSTQNIPPTPAPDNTAALVFGTARLRIGQDADAAANHVREMMDNNEDYAHINAYLQNSLQKLQLDASKQQTEATLVQALCSTLSVDQLQALVDNHGAPTDIEMKLIQFKQNRIALSAAEITLSKYTNADGTLNEAGLKTETGQSATAFLQLYSNTRAATAQYGNMDDVDARMAILALHHADPVHNPLPAGFRVPNFAEITQRGSAEQSKAQFEHTLEILKLNGITPDNLEEKMKDDSVLKALGGMSNAEATAAIGVLTGWLQGKSQSIQMTSARAQAFAAWPDALVRTFQNGMTVIGAVAGTVIAAGVIVEFADRGLDMALPPGSPRSGALADLKKITGTLREGEEKFVLGAVHKVAGLMPTNSGG